MCGKLPYNGMDWSTPPRECTPMASALPNQNTRLDFRLPAEQKTLIERAAAVQGRSITDFALDALARAAHEAIEQAALTRLSTRDRDVFLNMLDSDVEPNAALKKAARRFKARRGEG